MAGGLKTAQYAAMRELKLSLDQVGAGGFRMWRAGKNNLCVFWNLAKGGFESKVL